VEDKENILTMKDRQKQGLENPKKRVKDVLIEEEETTHIQNITKFDEDVEERRCWENRQVSSLHIQTKERIKQYKEKE